MPANAIPFLPSLARNPPTIAPPSLAPKPGIGGGFLPDEGGLDLDLLRERVAALDEEMQMRLSAPPVEGEDTGLARFVIPILGAIGGLAMGGDAMSAAVGFGAGGQAITDVETKRDARAAATEARRERDLRTLGNLRETAGRELTDATQTVARREEVAGKLKFEEGVEKRRETEAERDRRFRKDLETSQSGFRKELQDDQQAWQSARDKAADLEAARIRAERAGEREADLLADTTVSIFKEMTDPTVIEAQIQTIADPKKRNAARAEAYTAAFRQARAAAEAAVQKSSVVDRVAEQVEPLIVGATEVEIVKELLESAVAQGDTLTAQRIARRILEIRQGGAAKPVGGPTPGAPVPTAPDTTAGTTPAVPTPTATADPDSAFREMVMRELRTP